MFDFCESLQYNEYGNAAYLGNANNPYVFLMWGTGDGITFCTINEKTKCIASFAFQYRSNSLENITFEGTIAEWRAISKTDWYCGINYTNVVHCKDGDTSI